MPSRRVEFAPLLLLAPFVALCGYIASYYALVREGTYNDRLQVGNLEADYAFIGKRGDCIFAPIHQFDRQVRTEFWTISPWYHTDGDVQYFSPGPEFRLSREVAERKTRQAEAREQAANAGNDNQ